MGTIIFKTDKEPGRVLMEELQSDAVRVRMFTMDASAACVALVADINALDQRSAEMLHAVYDVPASGRVVVACLCAHRGLDETGPRSVSVKFLDEITGPYRTGSANRQLLSLLSPLRAPEDVPARYHLLNEWAREWRNRAWEASDARERTKVPA